ncbi:MAG: di-trans,poly-cis-decaprenylcistransferase [Alistipes sp.]|nr:di-trans,poly-cis-decaprenylcistransferase [Candidatus Alistipes equi]
MDIEKKIPEHVAIIMDGNGRWAAMHGKPRYEGHIEGINSIRECIKAAQRNGVRYLTMYAFSTENWGRPIEEVNALMELFCSSVENETAELIKEGAKVKIIGRRDRFSQKVLEHLNQIEKDTSKGERITVIIAFDYSSREEITHALKNIVIKAQKGEITADNINDETFSAELYTAGIPDPDFIIRTSGECRLSNFLLWQASYAEMYFPKTLWPDFRGEAFDEAIEEYSRRNRRYGLLK